MTANKRWSLALVCLLSLLGSTAANADIYKWTDENGKTVISNSRPESGQKVKNLEVTVRETKSPVVPQTTQQMLLDKLDNLERQLAAQQQTQALPPPPYYSASPPPPPPNYYYPDSYAGYYPSVAAYPYGFYGGTPFFGRARHAFPPHAAHYGNQFLPRHSVTIGLAPIHGGFARGGGGMGGGRR
jgi:hypothetical protein